MLRGRVKWFDNKKGFGFLTQNRGLDVLVHFRALRGEVGWKSLRKGEDVLFEIERTVKGLRATVVRRLP